MRRFLVLEVIVAALAVTACGTAHAGQGTAGAQPKTPPGTLHVYTSAQAQARHLSGVPWTLVRMEQGGRIAVVKYVAGGCRPKPVGAVVTSATKSVTLSLVGPQLKTGTVCEPTLLSGTAKIAMPAMGGRQLLHAPVPAMERSGHSGAGLSG
jgi:hypothetical protein